MIKIGNTYIPKSYIETKLKAVQKDETGETTLFLQFLDDCGRFLVVQIKVKLDVATQTSLDVFLGLADAMTFKECESGKIQLAKD